MKENFKQEEILENIVAVSDCLYTLIRKFEFNGVLGVVFQRLTKILLFTFKGV